jgi:chemotaxis signal transduction protein
MLVIILRVADRRYALPGVDVVEVLPVVALQHLAGAPPSHAGFFTYRGVIAHALDLGVALGLGPCDRRFGARIVMLACATETGPPRGFLVDAVPDARRIDETRCEPVAAMAGGAKLAGAIERLVIDGGETLPLISARPLLARASVDVGRGAL